MLAVEGLGKRYGSRWIFRRLDFQLGMGDRLVVLGRNGSGKSTLLKVISGLVPENEGSVHLPSEARLCLGYSAIEQNLYPNLTCGEHLEFSGALRGCLSRRDELLAKVGLRDAINKPAIEISTGMKTRLRLAMAIQAEPKVLLLDEPGAALDEFGRALVQQIADEQSSRGCLIVATNDPTERSLATLELELLD